MPDTKCGFVAIIGRPNVGKSTFLNHVIGEKLTAVSPKAQTTRRRFRGILTKENLQLIFVDTPGIHVAPQGRHLNEYCVAEALDVLRDADVYLYLIDGSRKFEGDRKDSDEFFLIQNLKKTLELTKKPLFIAITKMDIWEKGTGDFADQSKLQTVLAELSAEAIVPISSRKGSNLPEILELISKHIPQGPMLYPVEDLTDQNTRDIAGELVQEQLFLLLGEELPYSCAVEVASYVEPSEGKKLPEININIHVERDSQKPMVIGKGGSKIKEIGQNARASIEKMLGQKVLLKLFVKVTPKWTRDLEQMKRLGYILPKHYEAKS